MPMNTTYGAVSTTTCAMPTIESIKRLMDDFERRWPKSERAVAIEMPPSTEDELLHACGQMFPVHPKPERFGLFDSLCGLRIETNLEVPYKGYAIRMADGSKDMHYAGGRTVKCLPDSAVHD